MQMSMQRVQRAQVFKASANKASLKSSAPAQFAGLRRANLLDIDSNMTGSLTQVSRRPHILIINALHLSSCIGVVELINWVAISLLFP